MIAGFELVFEPVGDDARAAGRRAGPRALTSFGAILADDGPRPVARPGSNSIRPVNGVGPHFSDIAVSITHAGDRAVAIAGAASALGIDLVPDSEIDRIARLAPRYLAREAMIATTPRSLAACFAAKEAGLKALGLGLLDGGMFETCAATVLSLDPPRLDPVDLRLVIARIPGATIAVAYRLAGAPRSLDPRPASLAAF